MRRRTFNFGLAATGLSGLMPRMAGAQTNWPSQTVKIVVPFPAGGTADSVPRIVAEGLRPIWKQPVIIENRPGAAGNIGTAQVAGAEPDGYTLLAAPPPPIAINQHLYTNLSFDPAQLKPVIIMGASPNVVGVSNKLGVTSVKDLIERAKAKPGSINVANQGIGTTSHLTAALFETLAGVRFNQVPYSGTAPAMNDLVAGHVDLFFDNLSSSLSQHQAGTIKILAVCSTERATQLPDIPTVSEVALPGFSAIAWYAIMAPRDTPDAIVNKVNKDVAAVIQQPEVQKKLLDQATKPIANSPQEAAAFIVAESQLWGGVVKKAGLKIGG
jgi:tripartite-type tricarboxylate transporter receptor subunit TctC